MPRFSMLHPDRSDPEEMNINSILLAIIFYLIFGLLLIFLKDHALKICAYVLSVLVAILGGYQVYAFITGPLKRKLIEPRLAIGLVCLLAGILLACDPVILSNIFPVLWGLSLLFGAFLKVQYAFVQFSLKMKKWWIMLIFALVSLLIGILALTRPDFLGENKELIIGIMLVVEAVLDIVVYFLINRSIKKISGTAGAVTIPIQENPVPSPAPAPAPSSDE